MFEYSSILMVPYAPAFSISITAASLSATGATPFFTSGAFALVLLATDLVPLHDSEKADARKSVKTINFFIMVRGSRGFLAVEDQCNRPVIYKRHVHHRLKSAGLDPPNISTGQRDK